MTGSGYQGRDGIFSRRPMAARCGVVYVPEQHDDFLEIRM